MATPLGWGIPWSDSHLHQSQGTPQLLPSPPTFSSWLGIGEPEVCGFQSWGFFSLPSLGFLCFQHLCLIGLGKFLANSLSVIIFPLLSSFLLQLRLNVFRTSYPFLHFLENIYSFLFPIFSVLFISLNTVNTAVL